MASVILRMNETDGTVTAHLGRLQTGHPLATTITVTGGLADIANIDRLETLFVLGHGGSTKLGGYTASALAKLLKDAEMKDGVVIELVACKSGWGGTPFALELKNELVMLKIRPTSVSGGTNNMQVKADGTPFTKQPGAGGAEIVAGKEIVNTPWGTRTKNVNPVYKTTSSN
jgi:hypothetical protein